MKKLLLIAVFIALCTTLFSCTADDYEDVKTKSKPALPAYADGPGDTPTPPPPPKAE